MASSATAALLILRRACSSTATSAVASAAGTGKTRRKKNLIDLAHYLPNWGVGVKFTKGHWEAGTFYQLTRIKLGKDAKHGAAWGVFHASGVPKTGIEEKIGGTNKRVWKYLKEEEKSWKRL